jgi:hypothetical protein
LKTKLDLVVIDDSEENARKRAQQFYKGIPEQQIRDKEFAIYGTREDVQDKYNYWKILVFSILWYI